MMINQSGQTNMQGLGCTWGIVSVVFVIAMIWVGGNWRTEVSFSPVAVADVKSEISVEENLTARHWLVGLVKGKQPNLQLELDKYLRTGDQVTQISIVTRHTFVNNLLTGITLGIYSPVTVNVRAKIARK